MLFLDLGQCGQSLIRVKKHTVTIIQLENKGLMMTGFTIRVVLEDAKSDNHALHLAMKKIGFHRFITSADGTRHDLPPDEYHNEKDLTRADAMRWAARAAIETGLKSSIQVTEFAERTWQNLNVRIPSRRIPGYSRARRDGYGS